MLCCQRRATTWSMHAGQRLHVFGVYRREHGNAQLVASELSVRLRVHDAVGAQDLSDGGGIDGGVEVDGADHVAALVGLGHEGCRVAGRLRPAVQMAGGALRAPGREVHAPAFEHPVELGGEEDQRGQRRGVVGLVEPALFDGDAQVE